VERRGSRAPAGRRHQDRDGVERPDEEPAFNSLSKSSRLKFLIAGIELRRASAAG
jgi:hypothetical protein